MQRTDDLCILLFIEPKKWRKRLFPKNDEITNIMKLAFSEAKRGASSYRNIDEKPSFTISSGFWGWHTTVFGTESDSQDFLPENGMITNSLCVFYLQYYRSSIPKSEMKKVYQLIANYKTKYKDEPEMLKSKANVSFDKNYRI